VNESPNDKPLIPRHENSNRIPIPTLLGSVRCTTKQSCRWTGDNHEWTTPARGMSVTDIGFSLALADCGTESKSSEKSTSSTTGTSMAARKSASAKAVPRKSANATGSNPTSAICLTEWNLRISRARGLTSASPPLSSPSFAES
jgi:hypothetical protein